jgi:hypothetical protein
MNLHKSLVRFYFEHANSGWSANGHIYIEEKAKVQTRVTKMTDEIKTLNLI